jgi:hypothetical protein
VEASGHASEKSNCNSQSKPKSEAMNIAEEKLEVVDITWFRVLA